MGSRSSSLCGARLPIAEVRNRALGNYQAIGNVHRRRDPIQWNTRPMVTSLDGPIPAGMSNELPRRSSISTLRIARRPLPLRASPARDRRLSPACRPPRMESPAFPDRNQRSRTGPPGRKPTSTREIGATGEPVPARNTAQWCKSGADRSFRAARPWAVMFSGGADYITGTNTGWTENGNHRAR